MSKPLNSAALTALGPTLTNCSPGRFVFVISQEGKEKLKPALSSGNVDKPWRHRLR